MTSNKFPIKQAMSQIYHKFLNFNKIFCNIIRKVKQFGLEAAPV